MLDLAAGTYDVGRGFATPVFPDSALGGLAGRAAVPITVTILVVAILTRSPGVLESGVNGRALVLGAVTPGFAVVLTHLPAVAAVHLRRLVGYERRLGRPILNR